MFEHRSERTSFFIRHIKALVLAAVFMLIATGYLTAGSRHAVWHDMFRYDGTVQDVYGIKRQALVPLRSVWLLVDQESGAPEMDKGNFMDCQVQARGNKVRVEGSEDNTQYAITEMLLQCRDGEGSRVFVVKGLAGTND